MKNASHRWLVEGRTGHQLEKLTDSRFVYQCVAKSPCPETIALAALNAYWELLRHGVSARRLDGLGGGCRRRGAKPLLFPLLVSLVAGAFPLADADPAVILLDRAYSLGQSAVCSLNLRFL